MSPVILVSGYLTASRAEALARANPRARVVLAASAQELAGEAERAEVIASEGLTAEVVARAARLRWWHSWAAGPDRHLAALAGRDVLVTSSKGNGAVPLAEHALLLMLMLSRPASRWAAAQAGRRWDRLTHAELNGQTCGIVGLGNVGTDLALKARALHMRVIGLRRRPAPVPNLDEVRGPDGLPWLLAESDVVVLTVPRTARTAALFGAAEFRSMRAGALFICVSRGGTYDEEALARALADGHLGGAGLDAYAVEPLPPDSPLWSAPNTIVTPHNGATTPQTIERAVEIFADNLKRYLSGRELVNVVDLAAGY